MQVQFVFQSRGIRRTAPYKAPRRVEQIDAWFKQAQKTISEIPSLSGEEGWAIQNQRADLNFVQFVLKNLNEERCYVIIDRLASSVGLR